MVQRGFEVIFSCVANMDFIVRISMVFSIVKITIKKRESEASNRRMHIIDHSLQKSLRININSQVLGLTLELGGFVNTT